jgi:hypothetical protein
MPCQSLVGQFAGFRIPDFDFIKEYILGFIRIGSEEIVVDDCPHDQGSSELSLCGQFFSEKIIEQFFR